MKLLAIFLYGMSSLATAFAANDDGFTLSWTNNLLTVSNANLPGGKLEIWYPEAFCRKGSTDRDWSETVLPRRTVPAFLSPGLMLFRTTFLSNVFVVHNVQVMEDKL